MGHPGRWIRLDHTHMRSHRSSVAAVWQTLLLWPHAVAHTAALGACVGFCVPHKMSWLALKKYTYYLNHTYLLSCMGGCHLEAVAAAPHSLNFTERAACCSASRMSPCLYASTGSELCSTQHGCCLCGVLIRVSVAGRSSGSSIGRGEGRQASFVGPGCLLCVWCLAPVRAL